MTCIYQKSKYYTKSKAQALSICQPIGYKFLHAAEKPKPVIKKKAGEKVFRYVNDKHLTRQISSRAIPFRELQRMLKVKESLLRKNYNLLGTNLKFVNTNLNQETIQALKEAYFPTWKDYQFCSFIQLLSAMQILRENVFSIRDYALSTYVMYYYGENVRFYNHIQKCIKEEFIQYNNQILINCPQLSRPQLRKIDYLNKQQVQAYISDIMQIGREKDELFGGVHLYISDILPEKKLNLSILQQETQFWGFLQFHVAVVTGVMSEGQHAVIKIGGSFTSKTIQYIFLLRLSFSRVYFHKSNVSNPFSNHKYIVCQFFNRENGRFISQFLINNYDQILQGKDSITIVEPKILQQNEFLTNLNDFNNLAPILKTSKDVIQLFNQNNNTTFYPPKELFAKKIEELKLTNYAEQLMKVEELIPVIQKKQQKKKEIIQKEAVIFDFEAMGDLCKPAAKQSKPHLFDLSTEKPATENTYVNKYMERAAIVSKNKKEQRRIKNREKKEERQHQ